MNAISCKTQTTLMPGDAPYLAGYFVEKDGLSWVVRSKDSPQVLFSSFFRNSALACAQRLSNAYNLGLSMAEDTNPLFCACDDSFSLQSIAVNYSTGQFGEIIGRDAAGNHLKFLPEADFTDATNCTAENSRLRDIIAELWNIIDDIDTASDIVKDNNTAYRKYVELKQLQRWKTGIRTDGYILDIDAALHTPSALHDHDPYLANLQKIAEMIGSSLAQGDVSAETPEEKELISLLRDTGNFWESVEEYKAACPSSVDGA